MFSRIGAIAIFTALGLSVAAAGAHADIGNGNGNGNRGWIIVNSGSFVFNVYYASDDDDNVEEIRDSVDSNRDRIDGVSDSVSSNQETLSVHGQTLERHEGTLDRHEEELGQQSERIAENRSGIEANARSVAANSDAIDNLGGDVRDLRGGVAAAVAAASHVFDPGYTGLQLSLAGGAYDGQSAASIAAGASLTDRVFVNVNASHTSRDQDAYGAGLLMKF